jgi:murein DD-endopeptidase MepM/ murein hydrolase activator NlpD
MFARTTFIAAIFANLVFASVVHSQAPGLAPNRPLDGRVTPATPPSPAGTTLRVLRDGQVIRTLVTAIPVKLPPEVLRRNGSAAQLTLTLPAQSFVIDPDHGEWYAFVDERAGYSLSVEGDNRLIASSEACKKPTDRNEFLGSTSTPNITVTDHESGPKKEILSVVECVPYRAVLECNNDSGCDALKKQLSNAYMSALVTLTELDIPEAYAPRSLFQGPVGDRFSSQPRSDGSGNEFHYHSPGLTLLRQYTPPLNCGTAAGREFTVDRRTPYSRLVFAGPDIIKHFPIVLETKKVAIANSQIFGPGGGFMAAADGRGVTKDELHCASIKTDGTMGAFGDEDSNDPRNFDMPWADTFCEWRGNSYTQPLCAAAGAHAMLGPHYGVDVRSWDSHMSEDVKIVSASDGVVVEVDRKQQWKGFVVKVRSQHLVFVYRHMNPDKSPFRDDAANQLRIGDRVAAGQLIGYMGKFLGTPNGTTKHLHFEIEAPIPKNVLLGPACASVINHHNVRVCTAREKAPAFATLIVAYLAERYGEKVDLSKIDALTGLPTLPFLAAHELEAKEPQVAQAR